MEIAVTCGVGAWLALITAWMIQQDRKCATRDEKEAQ